MCGGYRFYLRKKCIFAIAMCFMVDSDAENKTISSFK